LKQLPSIRKPSDQSPLMLTISRQPTNSPKQNKYFNSSLLRNRKCKAAMLKVWEGETPKPTRQTRWAPWLEVAIRKVTTYNALLAKERNQLRGTQVRAHSKKSS
jgi:hypothetical protein